MNPRIRKFLNQGNETLFLIPFTNKRVRWVATVDAITCKRERRLFVTNRMKAPCYGPNWREKTVLQKMLGRA